jgi:CRP-like cAMP-binding protein
MPEVRRYSEMLAFVDDHPRAYDEGAVIFVEGQSAAEMYVVRDGTVSLRKGGEILKTLDPGEVFGEMALIDHAPRTATAVAGPGCRLTVIDEKSFNELVKKIPGFALELLRLVVRRLRRELARHPD